MQRELDVRGGRHPAAVKQPLKPLQQPAASTQSDTARGGSDTSLVSGAVDMASTLADTALNNGAKMMESLPLVRVGACVLMLVFAVHAPYMHLLPSADPYTIPRIPSRAVACTTRLVTRTC